MSDDTRSFEDVKAEVCETPDTDPRRKLENDSWNPEDGSGYIPTEETTQHGQYEALHIGGSPDRKHTTGTIDDYNFALRVDSDAPDELVGKIESALADVKAEVEE